MIDILNIEPNKVSKNIGTYTYLIYSKPKVGKTTLACQFPKNLLIAAEKGYKAIPGAMAAPINSWGEFLNIVGQLVKLATQRDRAEQKGETFNMPYETITIDVVDILYAYCTNYILQREGVDQVKDIPYGQGFGMIEKEFDAQLQKIVSNGYGLILISHSQEISPEEEGGIVKITPTMEKRCKKICTRLVDVFAGLVKLVDEEGKEHRIIVTQDCPQIEAGTRFKYLAPQIPLNFNSLKSAIEEAIKKEEEESSNPELFTDEKLNYYKIEKNEDFEDVKKQIDEKINQLMTNAENQESMALRIKGIIENALGKGRLVAEATASQLEHLVLIRNELNEIK